MRGFEYSQPYYLNLAPNYDATITPRLMTKRGFQLGGQFRYLFEQRAGRGRAPNTCRTTASPAPTATLLSWKHTQNLDSSLPGLVGYWNLNKVSDDTYFSDLVRPRRRSRRRRRCRAKAGSRTRNGPWQRARARAGVPDAAGPDARRSRCPTTACRRCSRRCRRSTGSGSRSPASANTRTSASRR